MQETIVINSGLAWRRLRGHAAVQRRHGLQVLAIELLVARLAGGFLQAVDSDALKAAIAKAVRVDLGELDGIRIYPAFPAPQP